LLQLILNPYKPLVKELSNDYTALLTGEQIAVYLREI
jgi:hypothetical protein